MKPYKALAVGVMVAIPLWAVAAADGKTHEFQASKETLQDLKVGDKIEASLRSLPNC